MVLGKNKGSQVKLHVAENVRPVTQRHRKSPFHLRYKMIEKELDKLKEQDIIEKVDGEATSWVSPIVTPSKR